MDAHKNFARSTVAMAPSPAASGTSLVVAAGEGALFPAVPFNATVWPIGVQPTAANAEIVRVTAISTDTFTITRTTTTETPTVGPRTIIVGDQIAATITNKTLTDIEAAGGAVTLLQPSSGTASGTSTSAVAANVVTYTISGLTSLDTLEVVVKMSSVTQTTAGAKLYSATDSIQLVNLTPGANINLGPTYSMMRVSLGSSRQNAKKVTYISEWWVGNDASLPSISAVQEGNNGLVTTTTDFTGSWDLTLRMGGVPASGTFHYDIAVYKRVGQ